MLFELYALLVKTVDINLATGNDTAMGLYSQDYAWIH